MDGLKMRKEVRLVYQKQEGEKATLRLDFVEKSQTVAPALEPRPGL